MKKAEFQPNGLNLWIKFYQNNVLQEGGPEITPWK